MRRGAGYRLGFERQSAEDDIDVDARLGVTKKQHASMLGAFLAVGALCAGPPGPGQTSRCR